MMTALVLGPMAAAQRVDVWLEVGHVRGHLDAGAARRLYPYLVLGEVRADDDDLVARLGHGRHADGDGGRRAHGHVDVLGRRVDAKTAADAVGDGRAHLGHAARGRVAVQRHGRLLQQRERGVLHGVGRGHARVADAEVEHVLIADLRLARHAVREQLANRARLVPQPTHPLVHHAASLLLVANRPPCGTPDFVRESE